MILVKSVLTGIVAAVFALVAWVVAQVLFTLLAARYERRSTVISTNLVFSDWDQIFKNPMTTMAAIDRVVHHSVILDLAGVESYRVKEAAAKKKGEAQTAVVAAAS